MPRILIFPELKAKGVPWCQDHVRRKEETGEFPRHVELSPHRIGWLEDEIDAWVEALVAKRDAKIAGSGGTQAEAPASPPPARGRRRSRTSRT